MSDLEILKTSIDSRLTSLESSLADIKSKFVDTLAKIELFSGQTSDSWNHLNQLQEKSVENIIEIVGISVDNQSHLPAIIKAIGENISCPLRPSDLKEFYHKKSPNSNCLKDKVFIEFYNSWKKEAFLKAGRLFSKQKLILNLPNQTCSSFFFNQHLPAHKKTLLYNTKEFAREQNYKFVWIHKSQILLKKEETASPIYIKSITDLPAISQE